MGQTPQRFPGAALEDDSIQFQDRGSDPTDPGSLWRRGNDLYGKDSVGVFNLRSGSGITEAQHNALKQLIHFIYEGPADGWPSGAYKETTGTVFPTAEVWWTTSGKTHKIVSLDITWTGPNPTQEVWKIYDTDGSTVLVTLTDVITYSGVFETSRTRTWS